MEKNMSQGMRNDLYNMFKWAIRKLSGKYPDYICNTEEILRVLVVVLCDMVEDGEVEWIDDKPEE